MTGRARRSAAVLAIAAAVLILPTRAPAQQPVSRLKGRVVTVNLGLPSGLSLLELRATIRPHVKGRGKRRRVYFRGCEKTCKGVGVTADADSPH